jgi:hypothetical protein
MRFLMLRICSAALLICLPSTFGRAQQAKSEGSVWFVLSEGHRGNLEIEPIGIVVGTNILPVPTGCDAADPEYNQFESSYLQPGQTYSVRFGGAPAGIIGLRGPDPNYGSDVVEYDGIAHIRGLLMALATNAKLPRSEKSSRQAPSPAERKLALQLAREKFADQGLPAGLLSRIEIENLTHTILAPKKSSALIGALNLPLPGDSGITHYLFFIASESEGQLIPEFVWMKISKTESENEALRFVDQVDLFGDGQEEIVAMLTYYEDYRYQVYRRTKDSAHWEQIFETSVLGCL